MYFYYKKTSQNMYHILHSIKFKQYLYDILPFPDLAIEIIMYYLKLAVDLNGYTNFDLKTAYEYMNQGATIPKLRSQDHEIRPYLKEYIRDGHTFSSMMLEYTSSDFAIGQFASQAIGNKVDASYFIERSQNWKNIYNPKNKWLNSRYPNGKWKDINHDWREATYKNYFWMVPYNIKGLIDTIGGSKVAVMRLDNFFERLDASY